MLALRAEKICKSFRGLFKKKEVLHEVSLSIEEGEVFGILGPNGAGKTTLMSIFSTLIRPDEGRLEVFGLDAKKRPTPCGKGSTSAAEIPTSPGASLSGRI